MRFLFFIGRLNGFIYFRESLGDVKMEENKEELYKAFKILSELQMKLHFLHASENDDALEKYVHSQMQVIFKEFSDLPQALYRGYEVLLTI